MQKYTSFSKKKKTADNIPLQELQQLLSAGPRWLQREEKMILSGMHGPLQTLLKHVATIKFKSTVCYKVVYFLKHVTSYISL